MRKTVCATLAVMMSVLFSPLSQAGQAWESYKARFSNRKAALSIPAMAACRIRKVRDLPC